MCRDQCLSQEGKEFVVFDASAVACCKTRLFTELAPVGSVLLASL